MNTDTETEVKKASTSETGHYRNLANFTALIEAVKSYGSAYNPSNPGLSTASLAKQKDAVAAALDKVSEAEIGHTNAVRERQDAFEGIGMLTTRIVNALEASVGGNEAKAAKSYSMKIHGSGKKKQAETGEDKSASTSRKSYDNISKNFRDLCKYIGTIPAYNPNETDLQISSLNAYADSLIPLNTKVETAWNALDNARTERNRLMYQDENGVINTVKKIKKYVSSIFGSVSMEYKKISDISVMKIK